MAEKDVRKKIKEMEVMVADVILEAHDTVTLVLFTGNDKLNYEPGHFLTISPHQFPGLERWVAYLEDLKGKKEPPRAYSMSSSPDEKYLAFTVKEERYISGVTSYPPLLSPVLAKRTVPGAKMVITGFTGPYRLTEKLRSQNKQFVHICAGSGVVPSFSILKYDLRMNEDSKHTMLFSNKIFDDIIFYRQFQELQQQFPGRLNVVHTLTRETKDIPDDQVRKGRISHELVQGSIQDPQNTAVFVCGPDHSFSQKKAARESGETLPPSFMSSVLEILGNLGVEKNQIVKESYG